MRDGRSNVIAGTVREMIYLGSAIRYEITLADGTIVSARAGVEDEHFAVGRQVEIAWRPSSGILLADDGLPITI